MSTINILIILFQVCIYVSTDEICSEGQCTPLPHCPSLCKIYNQTPVSKINRLKILKAQCGFVGKTPKVCCITPNEIQTSCVPLNKCSSKQKSIYDRLFRRSTKCEESNCCANTQKRYSRLQTLSLTPNSRLLPKECGVQADGIRILGGKETRLRDFPWMAILLQDIGEGSKLRASCGGALISKRYVLTAAHCIGTVYNWKVSVVRLGEHNLKKEFDCLPNEGCNLEPQDIDVEDIIVHEGYKKNDPNQHNDIALIRLAPGVEYTDFVRPICLPSSESDIILNGVPLPLWVAGWGHTERGIRSDVKMKLKIPYQDITACNNTVKGRREIDWRTQFCAGGEYRKDTCHDDSGGPVMIAHAKNNTTQWFTTGIVSYGTDPCGSEGKPGVYTRVNSYVDWILSKLKE